MTLPMMPGPWDQVKDSVQSLGLTVARSLDPHFDAKIALNQFINQNPTNMTGMIDLAKLNPEMINRMYGSETLQALQGMGSMSSAGMVEGAFRNIANQNPSQVAPTVVNEAAAASRNVANPRGVRAENQGARAADQQFDYYSLIQDNLRNKSALENLQYRTQYENLQSALAANPDAALLNPGRFAEEYFNRPEGFDEAAFQRKFDTAATMSPNFAHLFDASLGLLAQQKSQENADRRQDRADERADEVTNREFRRWAADTNVKTGLDYDNLLDLIVGNDTPGSRVVRTQLARREGVAQSMERVQALSRISTAAENFEQATGSAKESLRTVLAQQMSELYGIPLTVIEVGRGPGGLFDKKSKFKMGDIEITGEDLMTLANDPENGKIQIMLRSMTDKEVNDGLALIETPAWQANNTKAAYDQQKALYTAEKNRRTPSRISTRQTRTPR